ncbi:MAG: InlB B-repeat-containing protein, partial [archaeon]
IMYDKDAGFRGWYDENHNKFDLDTPITRDMELSARWFSLRYKALELNKDTYLRAPSVESRQFCITKDNIFNIKFSAKDEFSLEIYEGNTLKKYADTVTYEYYSIAGKEDTCYTIKVLSSTTNPYASININVNTKSGGADSETSINPDSEITISELEKSDKNLPTLPDLPNKLIFSGWKNIETGEMVTNNEGIIIDNYIFDGKQIKVEPHYKQHYRIYNTHDKTSSYYFEGEVINLPTLEDTTGHTFIGWSTDKNHNEIFEDETMPPYDLEIQPEYQINEYSIDFESNIDYIIKPLEQTYQSTISLTEPVVEGYTFLGWYEDSEHTSPFTLTQMPANDLKLYAKFQVNEYTISFDVRGGEKEPDIYIQYEDQISLPEAFSDNARFVDWYLDPNYEDLFDKTTMPNYDFTLYAKWEPLKNEVLLLSNQGDVVKSISITDFNSLEGGAFRNKEGHSFEGYYYDSELTNKYVYSEPITEEIVLYEKWTINNYNISLKSSKGYLYEVISFNYDERILIPNIIEKEGYTLEGWYLDNELSIPFETDVMPANDIEIYSKWEINTYRLYLPFDYAYDKNYLEFNYNEFVDLHEDGDIYSLFVNHGYAISACAGCDEFVNFRIDEENPGFGFRMPNESVYLDALSNTDSGEQYDPDIVTEKSVTLIESGWYHIGANGFIDDLEGNVVLTIYDGLGNELASASGIKPSVRMWITDNKIYKVTARFNDDDMTEGYIDIYWVWDEDADEGNN